MDPGHYVNKLKSTMQALRATAPRTPAQQRVYINPNLSSSSHVFERHDAVKKPLQPPYDGPYKVLLRADKFFTLDINGRRDTVSINRLKPAYMDCLSSQNTSSIPTSSSSQPPSPQSTPTPQPPNPRTTRSGRRVHFPAHFVVDIELTLQTPFTHYFFVT